MKIYGRTFLSLYANSIPPAACLRQHCTGSYWNSNKLKCVVSHRPLPPWHQVYDHAKMDLKAVIFHNGNRHECRIIYPYWYCRINYRSKVKNTFLAKFKTLNKK